MVERYEVTISGIVQGVGFRPFVYHLARRLKLTGWVLNNSRGVVAEAEGSASALQAFVAALRQEAPPLAVVRDIAVNVLPPVYDDEFVIRKSDAASDRLALISPDTATCPDCQSELLDRKNRRYGYPFINCTNCGPRYTIITDVPYDRASTTMARFAMCPSCQAEYDDPGDRRFHAQPNACQVCGPAYELRVGGATLAGDDGIALARRLVGEGQILALKGIGGYHLACDARHALAVHNLRRRKIREDKPFAVMAGSLAAVRRLCHVNDSEEALLTSPARPIVLLAKADNISLADGIAPGNPFLGVMLPYAPIHWLLLAPDDVWVMTSGNTSDEPIAYDDDDAVQRLSGIADCFLSHNRPIWQRADDSVLRVFAGAPYMLRRSRGYVPAPIEVAWDLPPLLATGGELKNTFCLTRGRQAFLGPHMGDLENQPTYESYRAAIEHYCRLFAIEPAMVAYDLHPEYLSTKYALELELPKVGIQHHHAHIAAVMAEHGLDEPVIGVAFDGTGYGDDGRLWGGEFLLADYSGYRRLGHCRYLPLPGGAQAVREPWRLGAWMLRELYGDNLPDLGIAFTDHLPPGWQLALEAAARGLNAPLTSSVGRLFDAAAAILGVRNAIHYEGQAAIELERLASGHPGTLWHYDISGSEPAVLDFAPAFASLTAGLRSGQSASYLAASFHTTLAHASVDMIRRIKQLTGVTKVALSGGVFQNVTLLTQIAELLARENVSLYLHRQVPPNDGGISLGQAIICGKRGN